jgi:tRNA A-37 threonylcarbamoyl transferase component Bud32
MAPVDDGGPLVHASGGPAAFGASGGDPDADPMLGRVLAGRFTVRARLGSGSMGTVYRAVQAPIAREVALKILRTDRGVDDASRARFLREARANSALTSPNTVTVFDFGQSENGEFYLAMELLEGESVGDRIRRLGRLGVSDALDAAQQALRSLSEAHAKGIIHRDLKPDNLFYARVPTSEPDQGGEIVKVLDFGVAKMLRDDQDVTMSAVETQAGTVFGTPRYMSPEQAQGKALDARTDLYSLGVILYHMLTGHPPFTDDDAIVVMARHIKSNPVPLREAAPDAGIPLEVEELVMRALSKEPDMRPANADTMLADLKQAAEHVASSAGGVRSSIAPRRSLFPTGRAEETWTGRTSARAPRRGRLLAAFGAAVVGGLVLALVARVVESRRVDDGRGPAATALPQAPSDPPTGAAAPAASGGAATAQSTPGDPPSPSPGVAPETTPPVPPPGTARPGAASAGRPAQPAQPAHPLRPPPAASTPKPTKRKVGYGYLE